MAEQKNNAVATAGNIAHKLHGAAQVVRGAVTADFVAVISGATKLISPKVIAAIIITILLVVLTPVLVIFSLPQVLFNWGTLQDSELSVRHEQAEYLQGCYNDTNMSDEDFSNGIDSNEGYKAVQKIAAEEHAGVLPICAQIEEEIVEMDKEEKEMFLSDMGLEESGLDRLIKECYALLGLISYLTAGKQEVRAWTIKKGTKAPQAAGKIHSDFERGFIRAEVIAYDDLIACGSMTAAKEKGLVRSEGKDYVMKDGDVVLFRFNV